MDLSPWTTLVAQVGFPIVVAGFVLLRLDRSLHELRDEIKGLRADLAVGRRVTATPRTEDLHG